MTTTRRTALVVCPGRGTYNRPELGSIIANIGANHTAAKHALAQIDQTRAALKLPTVTELDQAPHYKSTLHQHATNAAALIYAGGYLDYLAINQEQFDIVALTGNSMGWYTTMACAGCWDIATTTRLVTSMAELTAAGAGAQFIYPLVDSEWRPHPGYEAAVAEQLARHEGELYLSIHYGGYAVLAGTTEACQAAVAALPRVDDRFPMILPGHAAFHTAMMTNAADQAQQLWPAHLFHPPSIPLIDGRGHIWTPQAVNTAALQQYTLDHQVTQTYHFTRAIQVAVKEFAPDHIILLGPGAGLGGAVAQALIAMNWQGLDSKTTFAERQQAELPYILSMGIPQQRSLVAS
ncbi:Malonyl CoA-acyl carrier protein transacylase [Pseudidiomarina indica]|uniref:[acyl-carrier-protein] S-malonyltransferase n=1 Tax=Pseudidiomarina indica TaxID=1159017 RepID=A0A1G6D2L4_9GAMM|nr:ACP S-malonyltransferase [Pseudidiomarina indica]SDB39413.1 Malonyl CoA-acyl carrier protein transacylase [Pseudidiomarina indica]